VHQLLHLVQQCLALLEIELGRLLLEQFVELRVAAIDIGAALGDESFDSSGGVAEGAAGVLDDILELLFAIPREESSPLQWPEFRPDADGKQIVEYRLGQVGISNIAIVIAGIKSIRVSGFS
jgi:hypothetical protein